MHRSSDVREPGWLKGINITVLGVVGYVAANVGVSIDASDYGPRCLYGTGVCPPFVVDWAYFIVPQVAVGVLGLAAAIWGLWIAQRPPRSRWPLLASLPFLAAVFAYFGSFDLSNIAATVAIEEADFYRSMSAAFLLSAQVLIIFEGVLVGVLVFWSLSRRVRARR